MMENKQSVQIWTIAGGFKEKLTKSVKTTKATQQVQENLRTSSATILQQFPNKVGTGGLKIPSNIFLSIFSIYSSTIYILALKYTL